MHTCKVYIILHFGNAWSESGFQKEKKYWVTKFRSKYWPMVEQTGQSMKDFYQKPQASLGRGKQQISKQ